MIKKIYVTISDRQNVTSEYSYIQTSSVTGRTFTESNGTNTDTTKSD